MSTGIIETIKEAAVNAWRSTKPPEITFGTVESTNPLKIKISSLITLSEQQCVINGTITEGDIVIVIRMQGGQKYVILGDRTVTIDDTVYIETGGTVSASVSSGGWMYPLGTQARVSSKYGYRIHPITGKRKMHTGVDLACGKNTAVLASKSGTVSLVKSSSTGYGKQVQINHGGGYTTLYAHLNSYNVKVGQKVAQGEVIGRVDSTGSSTGHHLHFEVRVNNSPKNPFNYIPSKK